MPAPIVASHLSPNNTGISVEADSPLSTTPHRIRMPQELSRNADTTDTSPSLSANISSPSIISPPIRRANTLNIISNLNSNEKLQSVGSISPVKSDSSKIPSFHIPYSERSKQTTDSHASHRPLSWTGSLRSKTDIVPPERQSSPTKSPTASSVMHPTPYRSSYLASKKSGSYGEALSAGSRRKLGNHLPRIASGDGDDSWAAGSPVKKDTELAPRLDKRKSLRDRDFNVDTERHDPTQPGVVDGVAGLPGRLHLKAPNNALSKPTPSSRFLGGSWADRQRHLIQAYEYLCHVGEAQQWIEGCLGEELEFGVVELEDGLRNGVVLAKLVRAFHGESAVRRIYEVRTSCAILK
jgi:Ras GTPase-activating-like protein IQGAP2/3